MVENFYCFVYVNAVSFMVVIVKSMYGFLATARAFGATAVEEPHTHSTVKITRQFKRGFSSSLYHLIIKVLILC
jgi:hypothetical protein